MENTDVREVLWTKIFLPLFQPLISPWRSPKTPHSSSNGSQTTTITRQQAAISSDRPWVSLLDLCSGAWTVHALTPAKTRLSRYEIGSPKCLRSAVGGSLEESLRDARLKQESFYILQVSRECGAAPRIGACWRIS